MTKRARLLEAEWIGAGSPNRTGDAIIAVSETQEAVEPGDLVEVEGLGLCVADLVEDDAPPLKLGVAKRLRPGEMAVRLDLEIVK